ncbi:MAG: flap endonuclease-1 [Candidatus Argoarchaeum ethanivorans]|uniref:Flap endonuclease 1 n=1 Tax=Candidatus Argoarchaeum ethanivorans TaxID=2608793 RepID=A0A8B3S7E3_9EURY|nr:MAG: flap endonuclease-1 [Candidatus Argoarchaeum ethanivorans]
MGVDIGELFNKKEIELSNLSGKTIAIDAYNTLYQFLSIIRQRDGTPLKDSTGRITSHLSGLFYRCTNLLEANIKLVFVFDGVPPGFKAETIEKRIQHRIAAQEKWEKALAEGSENVMTYAQAASRMDDFMVDEAKTLLAYMGIPIVQAPTEGEAQAAYMAGHGDAYAAATQDYDSLLFGAPLVVRNLAITGRRKLPRKNVYVDVKPELLNVEENLSRLNLTREQLIDIALLIGTDYNEGIKGIGPKKALKLIQTHKNIDTVLKHLGTQIKELEVIKNFFYYPEVLEDYTIEYRKPGADDIIEFLCEKHDFSVERVSKAVKRLEVASDFRQKTFDAWF